LGKPLPVLNYRRRIQHIVLDSTYPTKQTKQTKHHPSSIKTRVLFELTYELRIYVTSGTKGKKEERDKYEETSTTTTNEKEDDDENEIVVVVDVFLALVYGFG
jgi:hypothetical protein